VNHFSGEVEGAVRKLLEPAAFAGYRAKAAAMDNRAVFEIPRLLAKISGS
jgi:hypothetical protein